MHEKNLKTGTTLSDLCGNGVDGLLDWGSLLGLWGVLVELHQFGEIELWLLEDLGLSDHAVVLEWVDFAALGLNLLSNFFFQAN